MQRSKQSRPEHDRATSPDPLPGFHRLLFETDHMSTTAQAARTLARGRRTQNWLALSLVASGLLNIAVPIYYWLTSHVRDQVVVFDLASGSLLLSPMVDPSSSKEILETCSSWAAKCILDRSPSGLDNEDLTTGPIQLRDGPQGPGRVQRDQTAVRG
jgi:hypothetical protein